MLLTSVSTRHYTEKGGGMTLHAIFQRYLGQKHLLYFAKETTFKALSHFKHFSASSHQEYRKTLTLILNIYRKLLTNVVVNMIEKKELNLITSKFFEQSVKCFTLLYSIRHRIENCVEHHGPTSNMAGNP